MKTARELLKDNFLLIEDDNTCEAHTHLVVNQMIEFAKSHVNEALKLAALNGTTKFIDYDEAIVYPPSIINAYPLDLIK